MRQNFDTNSHIDGVGFVQDTLTGYYFLRARENGKFSHLLSYGPQNPRTLASPEEHVVCLLYHTTNMSLATLNRLGIIATQAHSRMQHMNKTEKATAVSEIPTVCDLIYNGMKMQDIFPLWGRDGTARFGR